MGKQRAYGADATLKAVRETQYGGATTGPVRQLDFKTADLSASIPLGDDPLLGRGRNAQAPYRGLVTDEGQLEIPFDLQGTGWWMTALFGDPATTPQAATGRLSFAEIPAPGATLTLNGVTWSFVAGVAAGNETEIGATLADTLTALAADLNAATDPALTAATYAVEDDTALGITHDTLGPDGNAYTLAASRAARSAPTLTGGGYRHVWRSGADTLPSFLIEIGHPKLTTSVFFRHPGAVLEELSFQMGQEGPANATVSVVAQGEETERTTLEPNPAAFALRRFSQGRGRISRAGAPLAGVTAGSLTFSNGIERVRSIREDGRIDGADPTLATCEGSLTVRFDGETLVAEAASGDPVALVYGFSMAPGYALSFTLPQVHLPKPKYAITGPAGVEASFEWRAAADAAGVMLEVALLNDVETHGGT
ncbi:phage tail tube protein [Roseovarius tibetensis]|uniref:phage tail tube protein n=1 Tax=Roseovarius tibetensis TaxID=2685897 RepID=UPI003D7FC342